MRIRRYLIGGSSLALATLALIPVAQAQTVPSATTVAGNSDFGFDVSGMRRDLAPGEEFYDYANGAWDARTEIPAASSAVTTFGVIGQRVAQRSADLIRAAAAGEIEGEDARKIGDIFTAFMDEDAIERRGLDPLTPALTRIAAIQTRADLARELGSTIRADVDTINNADQYTERPMGLLVVQDFDHPDRNAPYLMQGGLTMPDREYYLAEDFAEQRAAFAVHVAAMFRLAGFDDVDRRAAGVLALETKIAETHRSAEATADIVQGNTTWARADFDTRAPGMEWDAFLAGAGLARQDVFKIWQPEAVTGLAQLTASEPLDVWRDYLIFHAIDRSAPLLSKVFVDQRFAFHGAALTGARGQPPRWRRAVTHTNEAMSDAVGQIYVSRHFSPEKKAQVEQIAANLLTAFDARIAALDWMSPETKAQARAKLATMRIAVGYPDRWRDYSDLTITRNDPLGNAERASLHEYRRQLAKLGQPVDRDEWFMSAVTASALNAPSQNSNQFPAALLEPPLFDPAADPAINYGAIGAIIGHEIVHGFDNMGAQFDEDGRIRNWWTEADLKRFTELSDRLVAQFGEYRPFPDLPLNGQQMLGENIADLGGLAAALDGYRLSLGGGEAPVLDGLTGEQRVFLGWAQAFRGKYREPVMRNMVMTNAHAPSRYRVATVRNIDGWYEAFDVEPGQTMHLPPEQRIRIW